MKGFWGLNKSPIRYFILNLDGKLPLPSLRLLLLVKDSALMLLLNLRLEVLRELPVVHLATFRRWGRAGGASASVSWRLRFLVVSMRRIKKYFNR